VSVTVPCPQCARAFAFDVPETPVQRAGAKGSAEWLTILAYYPVCPHCRRKVEVTDLSPAEPRARKSHAR